MGFVSGLAPSGISGQVSLIAQYHDAQCAKPTAQYFNIWRPLTSPLGKGVGRGNSSLAFGASVQLEA